MLLWNALRNTDESKMLAQGWEPMQLFLHTGTCNLIDRGQYKPVCRLDSILTCSCPSLSRHLGLSKEYDSAVIFSWPRLVYKLVGHKVGLVTTSTIVDEH